MALIRLHPFSAVRTMVVAIILQVVALVPPHLADHHPRHLLLHFLHLQYLLIFFNNGQTVRTVTTIASTIMLPWVAKMK